MATREKRVREDIEEADRQQDRQKRSLDPHRRPDGRRGDRERRDAADPCRHDRPRGLGARDAASSAKRKAPKPERRQRREPDRGAPRRAPLGVGRAGDEDHASDAGCGAERLDRGGAVALDTPATTGPRTPSAPIVATIVTEPRAIAR